MWAELKRWGATTALVRFSGGGGSHGSIVAVTLEAADTRELARWSAGEGELPEALAAPIWGRYGLFHGHPRISGLLMWDTEQRQVLVGGRRGEGKFDELLSAPRQPPRVTLAPALASPPHDDISEGSPARLSRDAPAAVAAAGDASRSCQRCGQPLATNLRPEARYCSKRCRQAASRERLKTRPSSPPPVPAANCAWCGGPMPKGRRAEAQFCSKRCRQASSRHWIAAQRTSPTTSGPRDASAAHAANTTRSRHG